MKLAFLPWFEALKNGGGIYALNKQIGDYSLLYQTVVAFLTYIDVNPVYLIKSLSVFFDFLLALSIAFFVNHCGVRSIFTNNNKRISFCLTYGCVILLPSVVLNSAVWGQCDSIYTFFLLWSVWFLYKENYKFSFFALGCSLAFKLQAVLLLPLFVYAYFSNRKFSLTNILITVLTFWSSGIVAYVYRQNVFDSYGIYSNQVTMFKHMWMNVPSFWVLVSNDYNKFHLIAFGLTIMILGIGMLMVITGKKRMDTFEQMLGLAVFIEWTCIVFLPSMHDRYTYVMDLLLVMLFVIDRKYFSYALIAVFTSFLTYAGYLFKGESMLSYWIVLVYLLAWLHYSYNLFFDGFENQVI